MIKFIYIYINLLTCSRTNLSLKIDAAESYIVVHRVLQYVFTPPPSIFLSLIISVNFAPIKFESLINLIKKYYNKFNLPAKCEDLKNFTMVFTFAINLEAKECSIISHEIKLKQ